MQSDWLSVCEDRHDYDLIIENQNADSNNANELEFLDDDDMDISVLFNFFFVKTQETD